MDPRDAYDDLLHRSREIHLLNSCSAVLGWDEQTYMPRAGAEHRGRQLALLAGLAHERATDPHFGERLAAVEGSALVADPESAEAVNVREWRRQYDRRVKLPRDLVEELARVTSLAQQTWVEARARADFEHFRPTLAAIVGLKRREAACLGGDGPPYDALLDDYEPGATSDALEALFAGLRAELVPLVTAILDSPKRPDRSKLRGDYPVDRQRMLGEMVAAAFGFDFDAGRLDTTAHPFCTGIGPGDTRITTRFDPKDFTDGFFSVLHEVGHGLYDQGLLPEHQGTPMGEAVSLGVHESQSRLWENFVGRGWPFWSYAFPLARQVFPGALRGLHPHDFLFAVNEVRPSLVRVQADEVTYNLHIMIRFDLEKALLSGDLPVSELPGAWDDAYRRDLGVTPADAAEGCLQDIHWSAGLFGYFPTYTLGNVFAAQLYAKADADLGGLDHAIARGDFRDLLAWLREKVHAQGQRHRPAALVEKATGEPPDPAPLSRALRSKYGELYGLTP